MGTCGFCVLENEQFFDKHKVLDCLILLIKRQQRNFVPNNKEELAKLESGKLATTYLGQKVLVCLFRNLILKNALSMSMSNLRQFHEKVIFCQ